MHERDLHVAVIGGIDMFIYSYDVFISLPTVIIINIAVLRRISSDVRRSKAVSVLGTECTLNAHSLRIDRVRNI